MIVIVEADPAIRRSMITHLRSHTTLATGRILEARERIRTEPVELVVIDMLLPGIDIEQECRHIRNLKADVPILLMTQKGEQPPSLSLRHFVNDFLPKPFDATELAMRVEFNLLRPRWQPRPEQVKVGGAVVDFACREIHGQSLVRIPLTAMHWKILQCLCHSPNKVVSRSEILRAMWGTPSDDHETRTVDVHIGKIRKLFELAAPDLARCPIETVHGQGYRICLDE